MSSQVYIEDIAKHEGQAVTLKGWLHNRRSSGKIHFLTVRDGSGFIQAVMSKAAVGDEMFKQADHLGQESSLIVNGQVRADSRAPSGFEIDVASIEVVRARTASLLVTGRRHLSREETAVLALLHRRMARGARPVAARRPVSLRAPRGRRTRASQRRQSGRRQ